MDPSKEVCFFLYSDIYFERLTSTRLTYTDPHGITRDWEVAERTTRPAGSEIDGVGILAVLHPPGDSTGVSGEPCVLLQKQYRPPVDKVCVELPAGLIDAGETPAQCATRELLEETGYVGTVDTSESQVEGDANAVGWVMFNDPGFCNTNMRIVRVDVDLSLPENQNPLPKLEDNEFIETFTLKLRDMWDSLQKMEAEGYAIDARVGTIAEGIECAKRFLI